MKTDDRHASFPNAFQRAPLRTARSLRKRWVTVEPVSTTQGVAIGLGGAGVDMKIRK
jgi:hypothetical protein